MIEEIVNEQRAYFKSGKTLDVKTRLFHLKNLKAAIKAHESEINSALLSDLGKSPSESYMTEIGMTLGELSHVIGHLKKWAKPIRRRSPLAQYPSKSYILPSPYGNTLVISPWNYPFLLSIQPAIGAIAAGNTVIIKPSRASAATSAVLRKIVESTLPAGLCSVLFGDNCEKDVNERILEYKFDYVFFTGGAEVGRKVYAKASESLTPVTLELGGKSPVIVDETAKIDLAARRIVFGKLLNAGQTCIAPDYVIAHKSVADKLVSCIKKYIDKMYSGGIRCKHFGKIISERHYNRVKNLLSGNIYCGGGFDDDERKIEPTVIYPASLDIPAMQEEIFGPVLPVLTYSDEREIFDIIAEHPTPLAMYLFTTNKKTEKRLTSKIMFGGGCVNDTIVHIATSYIPFGGVGTSGTGSYHGKASFETFSHFKSVLKKSNKLDLPLRYSPYSDKKDKLVKFFMK